MDYVFKFLAFLSSSKFMLVLGMYGLWYYIMKIVQHNYSSIINYNWISLFAILFLFGINSLIISLFDMVESYSDTKNKIDFLYKKASQKREVKEEEPLVVLSK